MKQPASVRTAQIAAVILLLMGAALFAGMLALVVGRVLQP